MFGNLIKHNNFSVVLLLAALIQVKAMIVLIVFLLTSALLFAEQQEPEVVHTYSFWRFSPDKTNITIKPTRRRRRLPTRLPLQMPRSGRSLWLSAIRSAGA